MLRRAGHRRIVLVAVAGLGALGIVGRPAQVARANTTPLDHILVPSYIYPGSGWNGIASSYPTVGIALLNVNSGPGTDPEPIFQAQVATEVAAGVAMYGYVSTANGSASLANMEAQISDYASWYGVDNIFIDEASTDCSYVSSYYEPLYAYIHAHGGDEILNPGTSTSSCYMAATDILETFEGTYAQYATYVTPSWTSGYAASRFFNGIYDVPTASDMTNAISESQERNVGWVYVTDLGLPNPYDALPSYWADEVSVVAGDSVGRPTVTTVTPDYGPATGGTALTITGTNFLGATAVDVGGVAAAHFTVVSSTKITTTTPPGTGTVDVTVAGPGGASAVSNADRYSYGPLVTKVTPSSGSAGGRTTVTIYGHNFSGASGVYFDEVPALSFVVDALYGIITAVSPPESSTGVQTVDVTVVGPHGTSPIDPVDDFTYAAPVITTVTPSSGPAGGGTTVTITGRYFGGAAAIGATAVEFGGVPATKFMDNSLGTVLTAVAPAEVGTGVQAVDVTVTTAAGTGTLSGGFAYTAPVITKISPLAGSSGGGTTVTITGSYFRGTSGVAFGGVPATKSTVNSAGTAITAVTPPETGAGVQSVDVSVTTAAGTSDLPGSFTYSAPLITKVSPYRGSPGGSTVVTITGSYFGGATAVTFGGNAGTITKVTATSITVKSPAGSGTVDVNVSTPAGVGTLASAFTYLPIVTRIAPTSGSSGAVVTVYGANFGGAEFVMFGTFPAAFEVLPAIYGYPYGTRIAAHAPSGNTGPVDVVVTTAGGSSMTSPADVFTYP